MQNTFEGKEDDVLLHCIWVYIELDLLVSFEVHTDNTIRHSIAVAEKFTRLTNISYLFHTKKILQPLISLVIRDRKSVV